jgi:hypothetical protein
MGSSHTVQLGLKKVVPIGVSTCGVSQTIKRNLMKHVTEGVGEEGGGGVHTESSL